MEKPEIPTPAGLKTRLDELTAKRNEEVRKLNQERKAAGKNLKDAKGKLAQAKKTREDYKKATDQPKKPFVRAPHLTDRPLKDHPGLKKLASPPASKKPPFRGRGRKK